MKRVVTVRGHTHAKVKSGSREVPQTFDLEISPARKGGPTVHIEGAVIDGIPTCIGVSFRQLSGGGEIRGEDLKLPLATYMEFGATRVALRIKREYVEPDGTYVAEFDSDDIEAATSNYRAVRNRAGGRGPTDAELRKVAAIHKKNSATPFAEIEETMNVSRRTAHNWVTKAREMGFLA